MKIKIENGVFSTKSFFGRKRFIIGRSDLIPLMEEGRWYSRGQVRLMELWANFVKK